MKNNAAVSMESIALIEKVNDEHQFFPRISCAIGGGIQEILKSAPGY